MHFICNYLPAGICLADKSKRCYRVTKQMVRIMKLTAILITVFFLHVRADGISQTITILGKNLSLEKVISTIKKQSGYSFFYTMDIWKEAKPVTIDVKNVTVDEVMKLVMRTQPFTYIIENKTIIISKKKDLTTAPVVSNNAVYPTIDIRGRVLNDKGEPVLASITVKGSQKGTTTNKDGWFVLTGIEENAILIISGVGVETTEVKADGRTQIEISVKISAMPLDEVQMIAYGTTTKRLSTGNVTSVKSADIEKQPINNPLLALQGRVAGLFITQNTGVPGGGITVRIQGQNSISRGSDPLYVIDGIPFISQSLPNISGVFGILGNNGNSNPFNQTGGGSPLTYLNPADIESIEVLKDADATSIYGSRAAAGAILITTKKGKSGKTVIEANIQGGWGQVTKKLDLLNTEQYLEMRHEAKTNDGALILATDYDINGVWDTTRYTDWQEELIGGNSKYHDVQLNISGGNVSTQFLLGANYHGETSVFPGNLSDKKASVHLNVTNSSPNQKFRLIFSANYMADNNNLFGPSDITFRALQLAPNAPSLYNTDGSLNWASLSNGTSTWYNPLAYLHQKYNIKVNNLISNVVTSYKISSGLEIKSSFGYSTMQTNEIRSVPIVSVAPERRANTLRISNFGNSSTNSWIIEPQANYKRKISNGSLEALIGSTFMQNKSDLQQIRASGFNSDLTMSDIKAASSLSIPVGGTIASSYRYSAIFCAINYNWNNNYIINFNVRRDGSSRFGLENQFHNFGSIGGAWIFTNGPFIKKKIRYLSFGKLRASFGSTGNDQIGDYQFMNVYNAVSFPSNYQGSTGLTPAGLSNPYLQWEETKKLQFGLDLGLFKDRILLNINYYRNRSSNQLQESTLPFTSGFTSIQQNLPAVIQNSGLEISLTTSNIKFNDISWESSINLTLPYNKLISYPGLEFSTYANNYVIGQPIINTIKAYKYIGVDPVSGLFTFLDKDGNQTSSPNYPQDLLTLNNGAPKLYGGFQNSFQFKGFELQIFFQFVKQKGYNYILADRPGAFSSTNTGIIRANQPTYVLDRWQKTGDNSQFQKFSTTYSGDLVTAYNNANLSNLIFSDASYIRLKNLSLSWQIPKKIRSLAHLQNARLYVHGQNLITITKYIGLDPETQSTQNLPPLKIITFGVQLSI